MFQNSFSDMQIGYVHQLHRFSILLLGFTRLHPPIPSAVLIPIPAYGANTYSVLTISSAGRADARFQYVTCPIKDGIFVCFIV